MVTTIARIVILFLVFLRSCTLKLLLLLLVDEILLALRFRVEIADRFHFLLCCLVLLLELLLAFNALHFAQLLLGTIEVVF